MRNEIIKYDSASNGRMGMLFQRVITKWWNETDKSARALLLKNESLPSQDLSTVNWFIELSPVDPIICSTQLALLGRLLFK